MRRLFSRHDHHVTIYGKPGCHLCDDVLAMLLALRRRYRLTVDEIDISRDPELFRRYDIRIPVLMIDDEIELEAPISERAIRRALDQERRAQS